MGRWERGVGWCGGGNAEESNDVYFPANDVYFPANDAMRIYHTGFKDNNEIRGTTTSIDCPPGVVGSTSK